MALAAIAGGMALAGGLAKAITGGIQAKKTRQEIEDYQRQTLYNPFANLQVSTMGAMQQQQNAAQNTATAFNALRQGGAASLIGGAGRVVNQNNLVNQQIGAGLDEQYNRNQSLMAGGAERVQGMEETREREDLAGLGQQLNAAQHNMWNGIGDVATGGLSMAGGLGMGSAPAGAGFQNTFGGGANYDFSAATSLGTQGVNWGNIGGAMPLYANNFNNQQNYRTD